MTRVCAVTVPYPGVLEWLRHGRDVGLWDLVVLGGERCEIPEADLYLLGAWHESYTEVAMHIRNACEAPVIVAWSSSATEIETAGHVEIAYLDHLLRGKGKALIDGWAPLDEALRPLFPNAVHLPAPIHIEDVPQAKPEERSGVGFYAPATPKKNIMSQLIAVKYAQGKGNHDRFRLHTNLSRFYPTMDVLGVLYEPEGWVERQQHLERLGQRLVCMAASHAESWCYGAVDAMMAGTPVVGSPTIPWLPKTWTTKNPNNPRLLANQIVASRHTNLDPLMWLRRVAKTQNQLAWEAVDALLARHIKR